MIVMVVLSDCPAKLRGDMTKWFIEINTGVYVGNMNARIRDELWDRITENIGHGHATMVFNTTGEQHLDFRVHNSYWEPVDFDGIKLMRRPTHQQLPANSLKSGFSSAAKRQFAIEKKKMTVNKYARFFKSIYIILDFETTGLNEQTNEIIEIGAAFVENGHIAETYHAFTDIRAQRIPDNILQLTQIDEQEWRTNKIPLAQAISELRTFVEEVPLVSHNADFEQKFLNAACQQLNEDPFQNQMIDTLLLAKMLLPDMPNYKLSTLAEHFSLPCDTCHRALEDCRLTNAVYGKLKELTLANTQKNE